MMRKYFVIPVILLLVNHFGAAQEIKPFVVSTLGAIHSQGNLRLNYTVGEIAVTNLTNGNQSIGQGFINSYSKTSITVINEVSTDELSFTLYPNPSSNLVSAIISSSKYDFVQITVSDVAGKELMSETYSVQNNRIGINTNNWPSGTYLLTVKEISGIPLSTYRLVKD